MGGETSRPIGLAGDGGGGAEKHRGKCAFVVTEQDTGGRGAGAGGASEGGGMGHATAEGDVFSQLLVGVAGGAPLVAPNRAAGADLDEGTDIVDERIVYKNEAEVWEGEVAKADTPVEAGKDGAKAVVMEGSGGIACPAKGSDVEAAAGEVAMGMGEGD